MILLDLTSVRERWRRMWARGLHTGRAWGWLLVLLLCSSGCRAMLPGPEFAAGPTPVVTTYTETLQSLGRLFDAYYGRDQFRLTIAVEPALDKTRGPLTGRDDIPAEITMMVMTALNAIHPHLFVSKGLLTPAGQTMAGTVLPHLTVSTAITTYDKALISRGKKGNLGLILPWKWVQGPEVEAETDHAISRLTIDMVVFDNPSQLAKPFAQATVEIKLHRTLRQVNAAVGVYVPSLGGSFIEKKVEGAGLALRTMVGLAVVQMLGRRFRLPYTRCLDTPMHDPLLEQRILDHFAALSPPAQGKAIRELLRGYGERVPRQGPWDAMIDARLTQLRQRHGLGLQQGNRARVYLAVYTNLPLPPRT